MIFPRTLPRSSSFPQRLSLAVKEQPIVHYLSERVVEFLPDCSTPTDLPTKRQDQMDLEQSLSYTVRLDRAVYLGASRAGQIEALAKGVASLLPIPVHVFQLESDLLHPGDGSKLVDPLMKGETVLFVRVGASRVPARLTDGWTEYLDHPMGTHYTVVRHLELKPTASIPHPGFLAVLHVSPGEGQRARKAHVRWIHDEEVSRLEERGARTKLRVARLGIVAPAPGKDISVKDLCLLHVRDSIEIPHKPLLEMLNDASHRITWTDLQRLLQSGAVKQDILENLSKEGRIDEEKFAYGLAAFDLLSQQSSEDPVGRGIAVYPSVYDAVWQHEWLQQEGHIFRGQFDARWPLDCSLLRRPTEGGPLDVQTLIERVLLTQEFLAALRREQNELFGKNLDGASLLAIAQHFGFPTTLLDYTRSLRIAAYFATAAARYLSPDEEVIGVIYHMKPVDGEGVEENPGIEFGLPLRELAGIHVGKINVVEPDIPDEDNRIRRQQGLFVSGFQPRDLQNVAIDRIHFRQLPGEVFEDACAKIEEKHLLPDRTAVTALTRQIRVGYEKRARVPIAPLIGSARLPEDGIIGSAGSLLSSQLEIGRRFFETLYQKSMRVRTTHGPR